MCMLVIMVELSKKEKINEICGENSTEMLPYAISD